jgi:hypothetical protein
MRSVRTAVPGAATGAHSAFLRHSRPVTLGCRSVLYSGVHLLKLAYEENSMNARYTFALLAPLLLVASAISFAQSMPSPASGSPAAQHANDAVLTATDISAHLFPTTVFFRGQTATVQMDNVGGVRYADGLLVLAGLVDNSGYASQIRVKYQAYLIAEVPVEIGGQTLKPGAYGFGFLDNNQFVIMDLGANDVLQATSTRDTDIHRPIPLQFVAAGDAGSYRLYHGRDYVEFHRVK